MARYEEAKVRVVETSEEYGELLTDLVLLGADTPSAYIGRFTEPGWVSVGSKDAGLVRISAKHEVLSADRRITLDEIVETLPENERELRRRQLEPLL